MKYFLAREGVAFGPYSELQLRESIRLGIFTENDLAIAVDGVEWMEAHTLLATLPPTSTVPETELVKFTHERERLPESVRAFSPAQLPGWLPRRGMALVSLALLLAGYCVFMPRDVRRNEPSRPVATVAPPAFHQAPPVEKLPPPTQIQMVSAPTQAMETVPAANPAVIATPEPVVAPAVIAPDASMQAAAELLVASPEPSRKIEGRIFLASRNGLNYQPSSVEVRLYPLDQLKPYLEKRSSEGGAKFEQLKMQIKEAEAEKERCRVASNTAFDAYVRADPHTANLTALERASVEAKKARETATNAYYKLLQHREEVLSGAYYLQELPAPEKMTRTDSSGRFTFEVPADGDFAVVAGTQRNIDEATERYYWFVPVSTEGELRKILLLSNNNLSSQGSAESLVQTVD